MNSKGQSLVLFILTLPIILLILVMIIDISKMTLLKNEINNINYIAIDYALDNYDNIDINEIKQLIYKNKSDINDILIENKDNKIYIKITYKSNLTIFRDIFKIESIYTGYIDNLEKIIERVK
ncbi:MAG: hypothetical protein IJZ79_05850 [Bacilli bacterium]|nr:hypothetical protein [Bacilli bacterium]